MSDYIVRATAANAQIRAFAATTREMVEKGRQVHETSPVMTAALGRLLTAGAMMGSMLKGEQDVLTLQIRGDGPVKGITVTADSAANVKGYVVEPQVMLPPNEKGKLDVGGAIGRGYLSVIKDMGLKEPYTGQTELQTGEIAEDLTYYFATSEQVPSAVGLGVLMEKDNTVKQAGGFIIKLLDEGRTPEQILEVLLGDMDLEIQDTIPTQYYCNCSKERVEKAIVSIGRKEINDMIQDGKPIEVKCHFCNTAYEFSIEDLKQIIKRSK